MKLKDIPEEIIEEYKLCELMSDDNYIYVEVNKGMYSLPQVGILAQQLLKQRLNKHGYRQSAIIPGF
jgi:hypothetical protein